MNDFDDLDDLFGQLRSAATGAELAGETSHVDAMARHHRRQKGHTMITSRRARVAAFVAAGVIGFGGVAAAGPGGPFALTGADDTTTTSEVTTTTSEVPTTTSEVPTTTSEVTTTTSEVVLEEDAPVTRSVIEQTVVAADTDLDDDPVAEFDVTKCFGLDPAQFDNHGEFVSAVARGDVELPEGIEQRDAAQSSCGKDDDDEVEVTDDEVEVKDIDDDGDDDDSDSDSDDDSDGDDSDDDGDDDRPEKSGKPDKPGKPGKPESAGKQGNGSKKNSDD